ncbi:hypothetical protein [Psychrobacter sp. K31L]|uniref:hypothetical protein n=1 Tax=Psychrobacter sp. K31L TaxID=2820758 RepID=UPI001D17E113|nr:hypothetical protein [Psychrobacter sp. K31L]
MLPATLVSTAFSCDTLTASVSAPPAATLVNRRSLLALPILTTLLPVVVPTTVVPVGAKLGTLEAVTVVLLPIPTAPLSPAAILILLPTAKALLAPMVLSLPNE